ncbi:MAG: flavodoxin [Planctomycetota bacterium]
MRVAIVWGSTTGNTQVAADQLHKELGDLITTHCHVDSLPIGEMMTYDVVLAGVSTWDIGELQYDWEVRAEEMAEQDWTGKRIGFFGCGDGIGYHDTFVDAFGILWEQVGPRGAGLIGKWPVDGYDYSDSRALCDGGKSFLGLPIDIENQADLTDDRIKRWAEQIRRELRDTPSEVAKSS